jgi:hypothetical protein
MREPKGERSMTPSQIPLPFPIFEAVLRIAAAAAAAWPPFPAEADENHEVPPDLTFSASLQLPLFGRM